ncbi:PP2C family protein-serine/threonine phosphatase [Tunturiibacter gelidoferens]|uniref:Serine phosphatase RsbU (Regulator of sigma subunit) n=1 Tax=Tunturiibacter gelidiferens TaxID=3069689 RepID=A0A9X0U593_9BACT|nr:SpoIIE family protein phosphatase [Edaphobacter lichenicola]MBB5330173.1 serine phosphatase RsbU (regulator of sigma subunit) [Edaphobacter lichenicola]
MKPSPGPLQTSPSLLTETGPRDCPECVYLRVFKTTIYVRDHDLSLKFYVDQLGFSVVADARFDFDGRWVAIAPPDGSTVLALIAPKRGSENYKLIGRNTQVGFLSEDINATYEQWRNRGVRFHHPPQQTLFGGTVAGFYDIDGNSFELLGSDQITREIERQRRQAAERLELERRSAQELEIAKQVQARLFPQTLPPLKTLDYAGICIQARHVGGDYYDFLALGNQRLGFVIGDIAGKGIAAALLMANLQANLRSQFALARDEPLLFLQSVNRLFFHSTADSAYATVFFADYDDAERRLRYANCGHLSAILLRQNGQVERLHATATVLGLFEEWHSPTVDCQFSTGDIFTLYTDGVTEAFNESEEEFGEDRLIAALERHSKLPPQALLSAIVDEIKTFSPHEQHDDITLIVAKCTAAP